MNRRDFELVARLVKRLPTRDVEPQDTRTTVAIMFADAIEGDRGNSGFDRTKFLKQCGVSRGE